MTFTGDVEMLQTIQCEVKRLCKKENVVLSILQRDKREDYLRDFERMIAADAHAQSRCTEALQLERSVKSGDSSKRSWDPILAGFRARSVLSEPSTPTVMKMERSLLPMDLNSATSDGSHRTKSSLDSEYPDSVRTRSRSTTVDEIEAVVSDDRSATAVDQPHGSDDNEG